MEEMWGHHPGAGMKGDGAAAPFLSIINQQQSLLCANNMQAEGWNEETGLQAYFKENVANLPELW